MSKQKVILLVGSERTGKSNIVAALSERLGIPTFKAQVQKKFFMGDRSQFLPFLRFGETTMADMIEQTKMSVVLDRGWPCEIVYSEYFHRASDSFVVDQLDETYARMNALIVCCTRSSFDGFVDEDDPTLKAKQIAEIDQLYKQRLPSLKTRVEFLNVDDEDLEREVSQIVSWLE